MTVLPLSYLFRAYNILFLNNIYLYKYFWSLFNNSYNILGPMFNISHGIFNAFLLFLIRFYSFVLNEGRKLFKKTGKRGYGN